jgi:hypothetical protein
MLPCEILEYVSFYLENATEVGNLCTALNVPVFFNSSLIPLHIRSDMIACVLSHNRKDIFTRVINRNESFVNDTWWLPAKGCTWLSVAVPGNNELVKPFGDAGLPLFFNGQCVCIIRILRGFCPGLQAVYLPKPHSVPLEFWTNIGSMMLYYKQGQYELSRHLPSKHHHHWDTKEGECIRRDIAQERIRRFFVDYWLHYACMPGKSLTRVAATRFKNNKMRKLQREDTFVRS